MSFWNTLQKPFFVMAPLADVTDVAFRLLVARCGASDVYWTEFVSADGLYHTREVKKIPDAENPLMRDLLIGSGQRPIVAQIFSSKPDMIAYAAHLVEQLGFDGVDLNMGCPDSSVEKQGAGAALIKTPERAIELITSAQAATRLPVSVKTRVGYSKEILDEWLPALLSARPAAITLHLRTRKEMSLVPARWELMQRAVEIRDRIDARVLLIGNGDVLDLADARAKIEESGCDGAMIGRGMFGNPWIFAGRTSEETPFDDKLDALLSLARDFEALTPPKHFAILKKHIKAFVTGFDGAAELRARLTEANSAEELESIVRAYHIDSTRRRE
ncbi:tRNA-dihydrouridine synthase [Candidatus Kaiserbacteria bacterium CG10_big_fil_rev_8_21_14_0_10_56_12]|uniref:tRNA-dihydrouridine synthase n=1 Tax=Candidatus Kaiserbacteria bacterium CG10_big_fil_rev_8_21_14_0_10_56_12 TaxID=1974611 RepID=A0A2H0U990_9BACT|nr:MAG: tRNA-dihydrouridine synthase [Candidatus Kaiserbacteria bacterium CG10_big_fil_rev_8_21_14_0_10_56_12]